MQKTVGQVGGITIHYGVVMWDGSADDTHPAPKKATFWWEPLWVTISFWDQQMDLPFRRDRFVARAKMHQIEMLGLLEHDVLSSINVPYLPECLDPMKTQQTNNRSISTKLGGRKLTGLTSSALRLRKHPPPIHLSIQPGIW